MLLADRQRLPKKCLGFGIAVGIHVGYREAVQACGILGGFRSPSRLYRFDIALGQRDAFVMFAPSRELLDALGHCLEFRIGLRTSRFIDQTR